MYNTKLTFLVHASNLFNDEYRVLETSIHKYEPRAKLIRIFPDEGYTDISYVKTLGKRRFQDALQLLEQGEDNVIIIGADCELFSELHDIKHLLENDQIDVMLTSHVNHPCNNINNYYATGLINADFIVFKNTQNSKDILNWLIDRDFIDDRINGKFYDQTYLTSLQFIFNGVCNLRDDSYNVAWFNLHERIIEFVNGQYLVNRYPLALFHYTGYVRGKPELASKYSPLQVTGDTLRLYTEYEHKINKK